MVMLAIIESPLQLLNALELSRGSLNVLFISLGNERNEEQVLKVCKLFGCDVDVYRGKYGSYSLNAFLSGIKAALESSGYSDVICGDFRGLHFRIPILVARIIKKQVYLVDDGTSVIIHLEYLNSLNKKGVKIFSSFINIGIQNNYYYIKSIIARKQCKKIDVVIGSSVVNTGACTEQSYIAALLRVLKGNEELYYIPHRNETSLVLNNKMNIMRMDVPLELLFLNGYEVRNLYGICSSAMITLDKIYNIKSINLLTLGGYWSDSPMGVKMSSIEKEYVKRVLNSEFNARAFVL